MGSIDWVRLKWLRPGAQLEGAFERTMLQARLNQGQLTELEPLAGTTGRL